jgi:hypothetical protein
MSSGRFGYSRRPIHKDFPYLSLYRVCGACARDGASALRRRMSLGSVRLQSYLWRLVDSIAGIPAIFEKRPEFCPILVVERRMNRGGSESDPSSLLFDDVGGSFQRGRTVVRKTHELAWFEARLYE